MRINTNNRLVSLDTLHQSIVSVFSPGAKTPVAHWCGENAYKSPYSWPRKYSYFVACAKRDHELPEPERAEPDELRVVRHSVSALPENGQGK